MARCYYECGELSKALEIVESLSFKKDDVASGYGLILFLQARAIKGTQLFYGNLTSEC